MTAQAHTARRLAAFLVVLASMAGLVREASAVSAPRVWCHLCPWFLPSNLAHSACDFPLGMAMPTWPGLPSRQEPQARRDRIYECLLAQEAGIDAFAVDLLIRENPGKFTPALDAYLEAAAVVTRETGRPFWVAACLDGAWTKTPDELARVIAEILAGRAGRAAWPTYEGRPVLWTYGGTQLSAARWRDTFASLRQRGLDVALVLDANALYGKVRPAATAGAQGPAPWPGLPVDELDIYAALPVALYPFRTDFDRAAEQRCLAYLSAVHPTSLAARLAVGTLWPGYWSSVSGWHVDSQGTGRLRDTFAVARAADWLQITTWNDYAETTHVQPSLAFGSGRLDLLRALLSRWRGDTAWPAQPRLYVWLPAEVQCGESLKAEVLALMPPAAPAVGLRLTPCDARRQPLAAPADIRVGGEGVQAVALDFAMPDLPAGGSVRLRVETVGGAPARTEFLSPVPVWPAGYHPERTWRGIMDRLGEDHADALTLAVERENGVPARLRVEWCAGAPALGSRLFVRRNQRLVRIVREPSLAALVDLDQADQAGPAPWELYPPVPPRQRWGYFDAVAVLPDGRRFMAEPVWVAPAAGADIRCAGHWPLDRRDGARCEDLSPYGHHATCQGGASGPETATPGRVGPGCLRFDGIDDYLSVPGGRFPAAEFTVRLWVRPEARAETAATPAPMCLYADVEGGIVLAIGVDGRLLLQRASPAGWRSVTAPTPLPQDRWTRVVAVYDGSVLRLYQDGREEAAGPCSGTRRSNVTAIGCNPFGSKSSFFRGSLDEIRVDARALDAAEIRNDAAP